MAASSHEELSERELEILQEVATGATNRQVALRLSISVNTVKTHLRNIYGKLGVDSRTEATFFALQNGMIELEEEEQGRGESVGEDDSGAVEAAPPPLSQVAWPVRGGQWLALAAAFLLIVLLVVWPDVRQSGATAKSPFVDMPSQDASDLEMETSPRWAEAAQMPLPRGRFAQVSVDGLIYVIGGMSNDGWTSAVDIYDPLEDVWRHGSPKPMAVANVAAVTVDERIYVPGGLNEEEQPVRTLAIYDPALDHWTVGPELPEALCSYALAPYGDGFYLFGGWNGQDYVDSVYHYDATAEAWREGVPLDAGRAFAAAGTVDGILYLIGGFDGQYELASCWSYDPQREEAGANPWATCAEMSTGRAGHALVALKDGLYVVGGGWQQALTHNERYDVSSDRWVRFESPLVGEWRMLGLSSYSSPRGIFLCALGGWNGQRYLEDARVYQAFFRVYVP